MPVSGVPVTQATDLQLVDRMLQRGVFSLDGQVLDACRALPKDRGVECICQSSIHYPELSGRLNPQVRDKLNGFFKEYANLYSCRGTKGEKESDRSQGNYFISTNVTFEPTHLTYRTLNVTYVNRGYINGDKLSNTYRIGTTVDLMDGKIYELGDILSPSDFPKINELLLRALVANPPDIAWKNYLFRPDGQPIPLLSVENGKAVCNNHCSVYPVGSRLVIYVPGPIGQSGLTISIPNEYVRNPVLKEALSLAK